MAGVKGRSHINKDQGGRWCVGSGGSGGAIMLLPSFILILLNIGIYTALSDKYSCKKEFSIIGKKDFHFRGTALGKLMQQSLIIGYGFI